MANFEKLEAKFKDSDTISLSIVGDFSLKQVKRISIELLKSADIQEMKNHQLEKKLKKKRRNCRS